uniref:Uncharacterized protein n=1 Tax=Oryza rufipogon TaxID=4529 RepID=A0A0E0NEP4_ORYRU
MDTSSAVARESVTASTSLVLPEWPSPVVVFELQWLPLRSSVVSDLILPSRGLSGGGGRRPASGEGARRRGVRRRIEGGLGLPAGGRRTAARRRHGESATARGGAAASGGAGTGTLGGSRAGGQPAADQPGRGGIEDSNFEG